MLTDVQARPVGETWPRLRKGRAMSSHGFRRNRRKANPPPPKPPRYADDDIDFERLPVERRLNLLDQYVAAHPGNPVGDLVLEFFPELHRMREQRRGLTRWHSYIGAFDDAEFQWDRPADASVRQQAAALPRRLIPREHLESLGVSVFVLMEQSRNGVPECKKLDWGAWGWKLTGQDLMEFFGPRHRHAAAIAALEPDRHYVLVAAEGC